MIAVQGYTGRRVAVLGLGRSGLATARALVAGMFRGNAEVILQGDQPLARIAAGVATPGGITEMLVGHLRAAGALSAWDAGMEAVLARMTRR